MKKIVVISLIVLTVLCCSFALADTSVTKLDNADRELTWYKDIPTGWPITAGPHANTTSDFGYMSLPNNLRDYTDLNTTWELVHVEGPDNFVISHNTSNDWTDSYFFANITTKDGTLTDGDSVYTMKCTYKGITYEGNATIHTTNKPSSFPTALSVKAYKTNSNGSIIGDEVSITNGVLVVKTGEKYYVSGIPNGSFPDTSIEETVLNITYYGGVEFTDDCLWDGASIPAKGIYNNNTKFFTATTPGTYQFDPWTVYWNTNYTVYKPLTLIVTDEQGNIPAPQLEGSDGDITWYMGLPTGNPNGVYSDNSAANMWIPENVRDYNDLNVTWDLERVSGPDQFEEDYHPSSGWTNSYFEASIKPKSDNLTSGDSSYVMKATYKGKTYEKTITIHTVSSVSLPSALNLKVYETNSSGTTLGKEIPITNGEVTVKAGDSFYIVGNMNGVFPNVDASSIWLNISYSHNIRDLSFMGWLGTTVEGIKGNNAQVLMANTPGIYYLTPWMNPSQTNYAIRNPITIKVTDLNGNVPGAEPILMGDYPWTDGSQDVIDYPVYTELSLNGDICQWNDIIKVYIWNYAEMAQRYGGEPSWTVTRTDSGQVPLSYDWFTDDSNGKNGRAYGHLNAMPTQPMTAELTVTCSWGGSTASKVIRIQAIQQPPFSFPTGLDNLPDEIETQIGEAIVISPSLTPSGWNGSEATPSLFIANGLMDFAERADTPGTIGRYKINKAGVYKDTVGLMVGTILVTKEVTFKVKDASGNVPAPQLLNAPADATWYMGLPWGGPGQSGIHSMSAIAQLWFPDDERDMNDLNITWELVHENGPDNFELYHYPDSSNPETYFFGMVQPKSGQLTTGDSEYTMKATYKGITYEGKMTLHTVNTGMPTDVTFRVFETSGGDIGTEIPFTNGTLTVESGKKYWISGLFTGGTAAPNNQWINNQYNDRAVTRGNRWNWGPRTAYGIYSSNTEMFTAGTPGTYSCEADLSIGWTNLGWSMPFTMVVTNPDTSDPYFPEPQISIKSEYYADEEVLISLPWVNGAEYHEIRIFKMDGTEPYSWGNVHWNKEDIPNSTCCFQINVDAGQGQNRLMDPGEYYTIITVKGTGYRDTTFRRDFTILNTNSGGPGGNGLENGNSTWTWYVGLSGEWPQGDGVGSDIGIIQFRIPEQDWIESSTSLPIWTITNNHSSAAGCYDFTYVTETWNKGRGISLRPTWNSSDETVTGTNTYTIHASYNGKEYESTETIRFVRDSYPTGMTMTVNEADLSTKTIGAAVSLTDGGFSLEEGKDYVFTSNYTGTVPVSDDAFFMNGSLEGALQEYGRYSPQFMNPDGSSVWLHNQQVFAATTTGTYTFRPSLSIGMSNLVACRSYTIRIIGSSSGKLILPRGLKTIESEAFLNTAADEIDIPDSVEEIGENAFPRNITLIVGAGTDAETWAWDNGYTPVVRETRPVVE